MLFFPISRLVAWRVPHNFSLAIGLMPDGDQRGSSHIGESSDKSLCCDVSRLLLPNTISSSVFTLVICRILVWNLSPFFLSSAWTLKTTNRRPSFPRSILFFSFNHYSIQSRDSYTISYFHSITCTKLLLSTSPSLYLLFSFTKLFSTPFLCLHTIYCPCLNRDNPLPSALFSLYLRHAS